MTPRVAPSSHSRKTKGFCCYCKRDLQPSVSNSELAFTFDHINPQAAGGGRKVPCCRKCNTLKDDLHPQDWFWFISAHPGYWREHTPRSVRTACAIERQRRLEAGEDQYRTVH